MVIMEADSLQVLIFPVSLLETQESRWHRSNPSSKAWGPGANSVAPVEGEQAQDPRRAHASLQDWEGWKQCPSLRQQTEGSALSLLEGSAFLFYSGLPLIGCGPPPFQRATCFIQSTNLNVHPIQKHPHRGTETNSWPHVLAPCGQSSWHRRLTNTLATNRRSIQRKPNTIIKPSYNL